jgi:hypothetical protein
VLASMWNVIGYLAQSDIGKNEDSMGLAGLYHISAGVHSLRFYFHSITRTNGKTVKIETYL